MATTARATPAYSPKGPGFLGRLFGARTALEARQAYWGYIFLLPWLIGLIVFWIGPILASAYFSFLEYDVLSKPEFVFTPFWRK